MVQAIRGFKSHRYRHKKPRLARGFFFSWRALSVKGIAVPDARAYVRAMSDPDTTTPDPDDLGAAIDPEADVEGDEFTQITPPTGPGDDDDLTPEEIER